MDQIQETTDVKDLREDLDDEAVLDDQDSAALEQEGAGEMGELAVEDWDYQRPKRGEVRSGVILAVEDQEIIVDVGDKRDGVVPFADMQRMGAEALAELNVGDEVPVYILRPEDRDGNLLVSLFLARQEKAWLRAQELADNGNVWQAEVNGYNKGGLVVPLEDIRGFVPASQIPGFPRGLDHDERLQRLAEMVGETLTVKVIEVNRRKRRLILSASAAQRQSRQQSRERLLDELREGEVRSGRVSSLCTFGAFVDLGGTDGLIHLSELSWRRVRHPREVVSVGDRVEVYVLRLDKDRRRIGLSLKRLQPEPWAVIEEKYELGQLIEGTVTNVVDFGAFAEIDEGIEGLIHVSELTDGPISHPREVVKKGDLLLLRIIRIDARRKRLGLSLKRVLEAEWAEWAASLVVAEEDEAEESEAEVAAVLSDDTAEAGDLMAPDSEELASESGQLGSAEAGEPAGALQQDLEGLEDPMTPFPPDTGVEESHADLPSAGAVPAAPEPEDASTATSTGTEGLESQGPDQVQDLSETVESHPEANGIQGAIAVDDPEPAAVES